MIRLSTSWMFQQSLGTMLEQQGAVNASQNQVSSGKRIAMPSDDPGGAAQAVALNHVIASTAQYGANIDAANTRLSTESNALTSFNALLDQARSMALQGINGTLSASDRSDMATQLVQIRSQLVQLANTSDANGDALFSGTSTSTEPFVLHADGTVTYTGNDVAQTTAIGSNLRLRNSDPGKALFMDLPAGNGQFVASADAGNAGTLLVGASSVVDSSAWQAAKAAGAIDYRVSFAADGSWRAVDANHGNAVVATGSAITDGSISFNGLSIQVSGTPAAGDAISVASGQSQDIFATMSRMIDALRAPGQGDTALGNALSRQIESIDRAQDSLLATQTDVGGRLDRLSQQKATYADLTLTYKSTLSGVQDTDMASAISQLVLQSTALQASQQTFAKVQSLSLFNYLK